MYVSFDTKEIKELKRMVADIDAANVELPTKVAEFIGVIRYILNTEGSEGE